MTGNPFRGNITLSVFVSIMTACSFQDVLQNTVGGGKPKMKYHFNNNGWPASIHGPAPETDEARNKLVDDLQVCVEVEVDMMQ